MIPSEVLIDARTFSARKARLEQHGERALTRDCLQREHDRLREESGLLTIEVERLKEENEALRKSAEIWIRMYERQLERANRTLGIRYPMESR